VGASCRVYGRTVFRVVVVDDSKPSGRVHRQARTLFFYGTLAALTLRALAGGEWRHVGLLTAAGAVAISSLYGVTDEFHQRFVPGRDFELLDMAADALGSAAAAALLWAWAIIRRRSRLHHVL